MPYNYNADFLLYFFKQFVNDLGIERQSKERIDISYDLETVKPIYISQKYDIDSDLHMCCTCTYGTAVLSSDTQL